MYEFSERSGQCRKETVNSGLVDVYTQDPKGKVWLGYIVTRHETLVLLRPASESQESELIEAYEDQTGGKITSVQRPKTAKDYEDD